MSRSRTSRKKKTDVGGRLSSTPPPLASSPPPLPPSPAPKAPKKSLSEWTSDDVRRWLQDEGFPEFWSFLEPHQPTGIDLLMLNSVRFFVLNKSGKATVL